MKDRWLPRGSKKRPFRGASRIGIYPGQYYDEETGLHYNWNRYYDPSTGRYLRSDPAYDGLNLYVYVNSNPLRFFDPEGLMARDAWNATTDFVSDSWNTVSTIANDIYSNQWNDLNAAFNNEINRFDGSNMVTFDLDGLISDVYNDVTSTHVFNNPSYLSQEVNHQLALGGLNDLKNDVYTSGALIKDAWDITWENDFWTVDLFPDPNDTVFQEKRKFTRGFIEQLDVATPGIPVISQAFEVGGAMATWVDIVESQASHEEKMAAHSLNLIGLYPLVLDPANQFKVDVTTYTAINAILND